MRGINHELCRAQEGGGSCRSWLRRWAACTTPLKKDQYWRWSYEGNVDQGWSFQVLNAVSTYKDQEQGVRQEQKTSKKKCEGVAQGREHATRKRLGTRLTWQPFDGKGWYPNGGKGGEEQRSGMHVANGAPRKVVARMPQVGLRRAPPRVRGWGATPTWLPESRWRPLVRRRETAEILALTAGFVLLGLEQACSFEGGRPRG